VAADGFKKLLEKSGVATLSRLSFSCSLSDTEFIGSLPAEDHKTKSSLMTAIGMKRVNTCRGLFQMSSLIKRWQRAAEAAASARIEPQLIAVGTGNPALS
jgi:hypothetical protein